MGPSLREGNLAGCLMRKIEIQLFLKITVLGSSRRQQVEGLVNWVGTGQDVTT